MSKEPRFRVAKSYGEGPLAEISYSIIDTAFANEEGHGAAEVWECNGPDPESEARALSDLLNRMIPQIPSNRSVEIHLNVAAMHAEHLDGHRAEMEFHLAAAQVQASLGIAQELKRIADMLEQSETSLSLHESVRMYGSGS
jgi:hypothetical protein